jgi:hypothetical protein
MRIYDLAIREFNPLEMDIPRIEPLTEGIDTLGVDPLTEPLALTEAVFLTTLEILTYSSFALLFDLRQAIYYADTDWNIGLLICRNILQLQRNYNHPNFASFISPKAYTMGDCYISNENNHYRLNIDKTLSVACEALIFFVGYMPYVDENNSITSSELLREPLWDKQIDVRAYSALGLTN